MPVSLSARDPPRAVRVRPGRCPRRGCLRRPTPEWVPSGFVTMHDTDATTGTGTVRLTVVQNSRT